MSTSIVPSSNERMMGSGVTSKVPRSNSLYFTLEGELRDMVGEQGCLKSDTEEVCRMCARLALGVPMCKQISPDTEIPTE